MSALITLFSGLIILMSGFGLMFLAYLPPYPAMWTAAAFLASIANSIIGVRGMDQPTIGSVVWLYGSTTLLMLLSPFNLF